MEITTQILILIALYLLYRFTIREGTNSKSDSTGRTRYECPSCGAGNSENKKKCNSCKMRE